MLFNYLKIAFRNLTKSKFYSIINIAGLSIGMAAGLLIILFVRHELSYDKFYPGADRIYRVTSILSMGSAVSNTATVPMPIASRLRIDYPEIEAATMIYRPASWGGTPLISVGDQDFLDNHFIFAEREILDIFEFRFVQGDRETALTAPEHVLLTESTARRYFGDENPIGQIIRFNTQTEFEVAGVLADPRDNSHIKFDFIGSFEGMKNMWGNPPLFESNWAWVASWCYIKVPDQQLAARIREQLPAFVERNYPVNLQEDGITLGLQAMLDVHLNSHLELEFEPNGNINYVYVFSAIALLTLMIACINFMNLSTARSAGRAKEVGMRKVMGAYRQTLIKQFIGEALLLSFVSLALAVVLMYIALPVFNDLTDKNLSLNLIADWQMILALVGIGFLVGLISGSYPAFYLSAFDPAAVLKGSMNAGGRSMLLRRVFVVSQFVVSIALLISIGVIYTQLDYLRNKDLGFDRESVVVFNINGGLWRQFPAFKNELLNNPNIVAVTRLGGSLPGAEEAVENSFVPEGSGSEENRWIGVMSGNHDLLEVMRMRMVTGRSFDISHPSDSNAATLLNEAAAREFGWTPEEALGKTVSRYGTNGNVNRTMQVIGVVKDFHFRPLQIPLRPLIINFGGNRVAARLKGADLPGTVAYIQQTWGKFVTDWPMKHSFLDEDIDSYYHSEQKLGYVVQQFAILAIFIACLGLFGLASFTAERRTKEMGVRKVLGATTSQLLGLISRDFTILVGIAFVIAAPIAYFAMNDWLDGFAYRVEIGAGVFILAGVISLLIALLTVSYHALKAASVNPVKSLRYQ